MAPKKRLRSLSTSPRSAVNNRLLHDFDHAKKAKSESSMVEVDVNNDRVQDHRRRFDCTSPRSVFESLIAPTTVDNFFSKYWEKKPLVCRATKQTNTSSNHTSSISKDHSSSMPLDLFTKDIFESILENHRLSFVRDVNVVRYVDRKRLDLNGNGRMTVPKFKRSFNRDKGTVQIHQPQRYQNGLWQIMENLESFFGCLVGSNVYMTPSKSQGLPPHHDDVEVFVVQLEGKKHWRLYNPIVVLPREYSGDLDESNLGEPILDVVLEVGDVMYFPRGTIHQACTEGRGVKRDHSTHVTISTYQRQTWGDYLHSVFPSVLEEAIVSDVSFRKGLPINFFRSTKIPKVEQSSQLHSVVDLLLNKLKYNRFHPPEAMIEDFMRYRLPPYPIDAKCLRNEPPNGFPPNSTSRVRLKFQDHVCSLVKNEPLNNTESSDDDEEDDDDDDTENSDASGSGLDNCVTPTNDNYKSNDDPVNNEMLYVYTSLFNDRRNHMMGQSSFLESHRISPQFHDAGLALKFPARLFDAMERLRTNTTDCLVNDLPAANPSDVEHLLCSLWSSHLLEVQIPIAKQQKSKTLKILKSKNSKIKPRIKIKSIKLD